MRILQVATKTHFHEYYIVNWDRKIDSFEFEKISMHPVRLLNVSDVIGNSISNEQGLLQLIRQSTYA